MKLKTLIVSTIALVIASAVIGVLSYDRLPERVPVHFSLQGHADGYASKTVAVLVTPALIALLGLIFAVLPRISPRGYRLEPFLATYEIIAMAILVFEFAAGMLTLSGTLGRQFDVRRTVLAGIGLLFVVLGNFLGKVTRNFFVGIRTPWTLASDEVWLRTHRLGGVLFVAAGAVLVVAGFLGTHGAEIVAMVTVTGIALYLVVYSYVLYRRIENGHPSQDGV